MEYQDFIGQVQHQARLPTQGDAARAICATFETLGERLTEDEASHLAAQLPRGIGDYLRLARKTERFSVDEFYRRVADREGAGVGLPDAVYHARAVLSVLQDAATQGEIDDVRGQLPDEFDALFESGSEGRMQA